MTIIVLKHWMNVKVHVVTCGLIKVNKIQMLHMRTEKTCLTKNE